MSLLSGGEQALTALALIFAVFLTNPAPICVLDEVDAPLDDANVERFCDLLDEMARQTETRFVVITHNPITMARMDRLFGVTMAERGVSQLAQASAHRAESEPRARPTSEPVQSAKPSGFRPNSLQGAPPAGILGWLVDRLFGTSPWGLIVCLILGFCAGMLNLMRAAGWSNPPGMTTSGDGPAFERRTAFGNSEL